MSSSGKISLKSFLENVAEKLDSLTPQQLRFILMNMALQVPSSQREEFLDRLVPPEDEAVEKGETAYQEDLLNDIQVLIEELEAEMEDYEEPHWYGWDDEDDLGPYEDYVSEVEQLFDRINAVFDRGDLGIAADAYSMLFDVFKMDDDYGRGVRPHHLGNVDMKEVVARYLRSVHETASPEARPQLLFEEMSNVLHMVRDRRIGLEDLMQISTRPLPDEQRFLNDWISFLREQDDSKADHWLREAVRLVKGTSGLKDLALSEGKKRPRAFLDWIATLMREQKYRDVIAAAEKARQVLPPDMPIRAAIADHLREAAGKVGDEELVFTAKWEAFYAKPDLIRLLDVWGSTSDRSKRVELMQRASERVEQYLTRKSTSERPYYNSSDDGVDTYVYVRRSTLAHTYLLSRNWESAQKMSPKVDESGWSRFDNTQGLVVVCFLGLASGKMPRDFPSNLSLLWDAELKVSLDFDSDQTVLSRLKSAYEGMFADASLGSQDESLLDWCLNICKSRTTSIVQKQERKIYWQAASLITACAEVLSLRGKVKEPQFLIDEIRNRFPRHRSFQAELKEAIARG